MRLFSCLLFLHIAVCASGGEVLAKTIAVHGPLSAHVGSDFVCAKQVFIRVEAPTAAAFTDLAERSKLEKLLGSVRVGLGLECPEVDTVAISGVFQEKEVFKGIASASEGWVLRDLQMAH